MYFRIRKRNIHKFKKLALRIRNLESRKVPKFQIESN